MFCSNCGKAIPDGAHFCSHCGAQLNTTEIPKPVPEPQTVPDMKVRKKKHPVRNFFLIILALIFAVVGFFAWNFLLPHSIATAEKKLGTKPFFFDSFVKSGEDYHDYVLYKISKQDPKYFANPYIIETGLMNYNLEGHMCNYTYYLNEDGIIIDTHYSYSSYSSGNNSEELKAYGDKLTDAVRKRYMDDTFHAFIYEDLLTRVAKEAEFPFLWINDKYEGMVSGNLNSHIQYEIGYIEDVNRFENRPF